MTGKGFCFFVCFEMLFLMSSIIRAISCTRRYASELTPLKLRIWHRNLRCWVCLPASQFLLQLALPGPLFTVGILMSFGSLNLAASHHLLLMLTAWMTASYHTSSLWCIITSPKCLSALKFNMDRPTSIPVNRVSWRLERKMRTYLGWLEGVDPWDLFLWSVSSDYSAVSRGQLLTLGYVSLQGTVIRCVWAAGRHGNGVRFLLLTWVTLGRWNVLVTGVVVVPF